MRESEHRAPPKRRSSIAAGQLTQRLPSLALWRLAISGCICYYCVSVLYPIHQRTLEVSAHYNLGDDAGLRAAIAATPTKRSSPAKESNYQSPSKSPGTRAAEFQARLEEDAVDAQVCPDCYSIVIPRVGTCGTRIERYLKSGDNSSETEARLAVARDHGDLCKPCDPSFCSKSQTIFHRPDRMAPPVQEATTHYLSSIASESRVPADVNRTEYFSKQENVHPKRRYLFEYNPSIIVLPEDQRATINGETAYYLSSYRVSNLQQCITGNEEYLMLGNQLKRPTQVDFLALAYLRKDMSILQDVVLDLRKVVVRSWMEDYRLFVFSGNQIVVGSFDFIFPIWLQNATLPSDSQILEVPQIFPSGMHIYARKQAACTPFMFNGKNKNINFFTGDDGRVFAENMPMVSKWRLPASPVEPCVKGSNTEPEIKSTLPMRSFDTVDILHFWKQNLFQPYTGERGSACCAQIEHPKTGDKLLLGITHSKTPYQRKGKAKRSGDVEANMFFSALYAMESTYPYSVIARSGRFCLGHAREEEVKTNPFARANLTPLRIDREYDCPRIHFVSGISEVVDDPSSIIIGYGINDCAPRFVKVEKADIVDLLFLDRRETQIHVNNTSN